MDRILFNGNITTMDTEKPKVSAVAIKDGLIAATGKDEEILALKTYETELVDLSEKTVVPGFNDSHMHLLDYARTKEHIDLGLCATIAELMETIRQGIEKKNPGENDLLIATNWDDSQLMERRFPTKEDLDSIGSENPIIAIRRCVNIAVLNSRAIEMFSEALAYANTVKEDNAVVDDQGNFTGLLKGNVAISEVTPLLQKEQIKETLENAFKDCLAYGLTSIQTDDCTAAALEDVLDVYSDMDQKGELPVRVNAQLRLPSIDVFNEFLKNG